MAKKRQTDYTSEEIGRGLLQLAVHGSARKAARELAAQGHKISESTLRTWKVRHAERFREIATRDAKRVREAMAQECLETAHEAGETEREALAKTREQLKDGSVKDASTAARNAAVVKGISLDHSLKLRGEPTVVHEHRQAEDVIKSLKRLAPKVFDAEGRAEEIRAAQLPSAGQVEGATVRKNGHPPDKGDERD